MMRVLFITLLIVIAGSVVSYNTLDSLRNQREVGRDECYAAEEQGNRYYKWYDLKTHSAFYQITHPPYWKYEGEVVKLHADLDGRSAVCLRFLTKKVYLIAV